eukprot:CAMPEP_0198225954 /NCGR_PEP_ID=MMETSP1445-20131203/103237_1 /TAXON_ID=36898 /ORGANISM="Pyramimonas sp., Strain CCMP2087" /LENGTH=130 /DNA_ID=CAMNT_0043905645 /DNA_START=182 /DNA_END=574 /DNA_ORIENTATION=-
MADAYYWYSYLQTPTDEDVVEWILWQYTHLYTCYVADRKLIEKSRLVEIAFHDLEKSPTDEIRRVYKTFGLEGFESLQPVLERYTQSLTDFKKNAHVPISDQMANVVRERWGPSFETFNYSKDIIPGQLD